MKKIRLTLLLALSSFIGQAQVPEHFKDSLQNILNSFQSANTIPGISAAVQINNIGLWQGATGESHVGIPLDTTMLLGIGSNTKLFTSVLCLKLVEQNILTLEDSLHEWLPNYNYVDSNITIRQLLQHQSGVDDYTNTSSFPNNVLSSPNTIWTPQDILNEIGPSNFQAGTSIAYSNTNYILAGMILEAATGTTYDILVKDSIFTPLGLNQAFVEGFEPVQGVAAHPWWNGTDYFSTPRTAIGTLSWSAGCIVSKPSEMARWYDALFNSNFLNSQSIAEMTNFINWPEETTEVGLGVFKINHNSKVYWGHNGRTLGYSSYFIFDTDCNHSIAVIMNDITFANPEPIAKALAEKICELTSTTLDIIDYPNDNIRIYPNPNSEYITIDGYSNLLSISIYDVTGKIINRFDEPNNESVSINTSEFLDGTYFISILTNTGITTKKIITLHNKK